MTEIHRALERAEQETFTRSIPATTYGQVKFLLEQAEAADRKAIRGTDLKPASRAELARRVAVQIGVSQRTVERYRDKKIKHATKDHATRLRALVLAMWQPRVRAQARNKAASTAGITIETRARFGYTAPIGTTDDGRMRRLTVHLPAPYARRLFDAREQGATDQQMRGIVAEGLQEIYFKDEGRRALDLEVEFTDIDYIDVAF
ncbi:telomere-protecting terminal protein Tpg [Streptomyces sp. RPT161]|uniref:telomere-protecting terminal protein Tpg n=1 Tax=Streptomyces sp. RPT161 TaxID=3015993 RepID=UPI0022B8791C|nr:XRE family transcriptional regulator [Streptomyces sp. RPT161]